MPKSPLPKPVDNHLGKAWILFGSQPFGVGIFPFTGIFVNRNIRTEHGVGRNDVPGVAVVILIIMRQLEWLVFVMPDLHVRDMAIKHIDALRDGVIKGFGFFSGGNGPDRRFPELIFRQAIVFEVSRSVWPAEPFVDFGLFANVRKILEAGGFRIGFPFSILKITVNPLAVGFFVCPHADVEVIGVGSHFEVIHLAPLVEGVIMTLGAFKPGTEEYSNGVGHIVQRHPRIAKIVSRSRVVENQSVTAYQLSDEFVIGRIDSNLVFDPLPVKKRIVDTGGDTCNRHRSRAVRG